MLRGLLGKLLFKKTKLEHDLKMLLSDIQLGNDFNFVIKS